MRYINLRFITLLPYLQMITMMLISILTIVKMSVHNDLENDQCDDAGIIKMRLQNDNKGCSEETLSASLLQERSS